MENSQFVRFARKSASRKRATKACLKCRRRKVRCDVTRTSAPCTNCRLDGDECVVARRGVSMEIRYNEPSPFTPDAAVDDPDPSHPTTRPNLTTLSPPEEADLGSTTTYANGTSNNGQNAQTFDITRDDAITNTSENIPPAPLRSELKALYSSMPFLKALSIRDRDFNHLNSQGCLRVPAKPILDEFVRHYFLYVHPMLPLLNEADFWQAYNPAQTETYSNSAGSPVSLLLLQAIMFASCTLVTKESLKVLGFSSIHEAKESFYTKAKLLYDFATDPDPISIAQAALLLTYWCPTFRPGPRKPNSRWLRIAVQNARAVGADNYATIAQDAHATPQDLKRQNVLKRVWWCCIIRDRIMPLCVRRNIQITRKHFDFDSNPPLGYEDLADELESSRVYNTTTKHTLMVTLERLTELCASLTDILSLVHPTEHLPILDAEAHSTAFDKVQEYRRYLQYWAEITRPPLKHTELSPETDSFEVSSVLFTNLIWIYYHAARVALFNYELHLGVVLGLVTRKTTSNLETQFLEENRKGLRSATRSIADCHGQLHPLRLTRWLPSSAVACTALPLAMHMVDIKMSSDSSPGEIWSRPAIAAKQSRLNVLIQAFRELHPKYDGVDSISKTIRYFMECTYLQDSTPTLSFSENTDVLARSPTYYLRLALTIDLSLSQNRLPQDSDFPTPLRRFLYNTSLSTPALLEQQVATQSLTTKSLTPPRPVSPTIVKHFSQWVEDDRCVHFALEMGIDISQPHFVPDAVQEQTATTEPLPLSIETCSTESLESDSVRVEDEIEFLPRNLEKLAGWAENGQSLSFAQEVGLIPQGIGLYDVGLGDGAYPGLESLAHHTLDFDLGFLCQDTEAGDHTEDVLRMLM
ncbi:hypothetical protein N0V84_008025 [Fusarium piperis]|uniref:Zn(2)-C6 fungal-type domain-containing protein n=1 Tax=Fusarium piperis TaxID=1435070 RepID=A0A9W9BKM6_9HYPO|nr:hypothetical protein N0V84_008025 [Fusarium piperis]